MIKYTLSIILFIFSCNLFANEFCGPNHINDEHKMICEKRVFIEKETEVLKTIIEVQQELIEANSLSDKFSQLDDPAHIEFTVEDKLKVEIATILKKYNDSVDEKTKWGSLAAIPGGALLLVNYMSKKLLNISPENKWMKKSKFLQRGLFIMAAAYALYLVIDTRNHLKNSSKETTEIEGLIEKLNELKDLSSQKHLIKEELDSMTIEYCVNAESIASDNNLEFYDSFCKNI